MRAGAASVRAHRDRERRRGRVLVHRRRHRPRVPRGGRTVAPRLAGDVRGGHGCERGWRRPAFARAARPRAPQDRRHHQHQQRAARSSVRARLVAAVDARLRGLLHSRGDRGARAGQALSGRGWCLPLDPRGVRRGARLPRRLVLLGQQPLLHPGAAGLHGRDLRVRRWGTFGRAGEREVVRGRHRVRLAGVDHGAECPWPSRRQVDPEPGRRRRRVERAARACGRPARMAARRGATSTARDRCGLGDDHELCRDVQRTRRRRACLDHGRRDPRSRARLEARRHHRRCDGAWLLPARDGGGARARADRAVGRHPGHHAGGERGRAGGARRVDRRAGGRRARPRDRWCSVGVVRGQRARAIRGWTHERIAGEPRPCASQVGIAAHRAHGVRRARGALHADVARGLERGRGVPGAAQGSGGDPARSVQLPVSRAHAVAWRERGRAYGGRRRAGDDGHRHRGRVPAHR